MSEAIHPSRTALLQTIRSLQQVDEPKDKLEADDYRLAELMEMPGWKVLKGYIERKIEALKPAYEGIDKLSDTDFFQSYGMRSMIYDLLSAELKSIVTRVEDTYEEVKKGKH